MLLEIVTCGALIILKRDKIVRRKFNNREKNQLL